MPDFDARASQVCTYAPDFPADALASIIARDAVRAPVAVNASQTATTSFYRIDAFFQDRRPAVEL